MTSRIRPVANTRVFRPEPTLFLDALVGADLDQVIDAFETRIRQWYVEPAQLLATKHNFGFGVAAIACLLVDTLSQYEEGLTKSDEEAFKRFARAHLPGFKTMITPPIVLPSGKKVRDFADALWDGFRCAILHEARLAPYCVVDPNHAPMIEVVHGSSAYDDGKPCLTVVIDPIEHLAAVEASLVAYVGRLKKPSQIDLRKKFKHKFETSFGITIGAAI